MTPLQHSKRRTSGGIWRLSWDFILTDLKEQKCLGLQMRRRLKWHNRSTYYYSTRPAPVHSADGGLGPAVALPATCEGRLLRMPAMAPSNCDSLGIIGIDNFCESEGLVTGERGAHPTAPFKLIDGSYPFHSFYIWAFGGMKWRPILLEPRHGYGSESNHESTRNQMFLAWLMSRFESKSGRAIWFDSQESRSSHEPICINTWESTWVVSWFWVDSWKAESWVESIQLSEICFSHELIEINFSLRHCVESPKRSYQVKSNGTNFEKKQFLGKTFESKAQKRSYQVKSNESWVDSNQYSIVFSVVSRFKSKFWKTLSRELIWIKILESFF